MIATKHILNICSMLPKAQLSIPIFDRSYVFDANGNLMGAINWANGDFIVHKDYEHRVTLEKTLKNVNKITEEVKYEEVEE